MAAKCQTKLCERMCVSIQNVFVIWNMALKMTQYWVSDDGMFFFMNKHFNILFWILWAQTLVSG